MNPSEETASDQDPDYAPVTVDNEKQQKIYEENARSNTARKISAIVNKEFSEEIDTKEKEILQIQERLHKALKTLHLLRYVIIKDFYNRKQCLLPETGEIKQTRIHPAIKQLIGKSPKVQDHAIPSTSKAEHFENGSDYLGPPTSTVSESDVLQRLGLTEECRTEKAEKRNLENEDPRPKKIPRYVPPKSVYPESPCPSRGIRHKVRKRIVVGNISKWIPPDWREDAASHKWTMYVRSSKEDIQISDFVSKVRFFLHPSYRPNDVVEVTSTPFHLSRRGWGEFPLRVQLHFKNPLNKPMDIIHHLKLDRTYTGLQTLGSETLVDVWIHTAEPRQLGDKDNCATDPIREESPSKISPVKDVLLSNNTCNINSFKSTTSEKNDSTEVKESHENISDSYEKQNKVPQNKLTNEIVTIKNIDDSPRNSTGTAAIDSHRDLIIHSTTSAIKQECVDDTCLNESHRFNELDSTNVFTEAKFCVKNELTDDVNNIDSITKKLLSYIRLDHDYLGDSSLYDCNYTVDKKVNYNDLQINNKFDTQSILFIDSSKNICNVTDVQKNKRLTSILRRNINGANKIDPETSTMYTTKDTLKESAILASQYPQDTQQKSILNESQALEKGSHGSSKDIRGASQVDEDKTVIFMFNGKSADDQKMLSTTSNHVLNLRPLEISIPPAFESSTRKLLVVKNGQSGPTEIVKTITTKTEDRSLLKKSSHHTNVALSAKASGISVLKVKPVSSLILNMNSDVPALKIADSRVSNMNLEDGVFSLNESVKPLALSIQDEKPARPKVTLGKDKHKIQSKRDLYEGTLKSIETAKIEDTEGFLRFAIRRLPIVTESASDPEYRRLHPYACVSEEEFAAHNIGKQRAYEWYRAKMLQSFLRRRMQCEDRIWTMKEIIIWARLHGHMPMLTSFGVSAGTSSKGAKNAFDSVSSSTFSTCTEPIALRKWMESCEEKKRQRVMNESEAYDLQEEDIDVIHVDEPSRIKVERRSMKPENCEVSQNVVALELEKNLLPLFDFVNETARDIGIRLLPEEIVPNVLYCAAGRVIMRVIECFVEDLTRASLMKACERSCDNGYPKIITLADVRGALTSREEFDIFTNEGLGTQYQPTTSN